MGSIHEDTLEDGFTMETKLFLILGLIAVTAGVAFGSEDNYILSDEFIAEINQKAKTWTAGRNFDVKTPRSRFMGMMGVHPENNRSLPPVREDNYTEEQLKDIPAEFDPRVEWPMCHQMKFWPVATIVDSDATEDIHPLPGPTGINLELFPVVCTEILKLANPSLRSHANTTLMEIDQTVVTSQPQDARNSAKIVTQLNSWR